MELSIRRLDHVQLREYITASLGRGIFKCELTPEQLDNAIMDALLLFSQRKPMVGYKAIDVSPQIKTYKIEHDVGFGIFDVQFVSPDPSPSAIFYSNLLDIAPLKVATMESYDIFLRWRKTFMRITSTASHWEWLEETQTLMVDSPIEQTKACYFWHKPRSLAQIPLAYTKWVRDYSVAKAKLTLGLSRSKFQGAIPGPARDLQMNGGDLVGEAKEEITTLETQLLSCQMDVPPQFV